MEPNETPTNENNKTPAPEPQSAKDRLLQEQIEAASKTMTASFAHDAPDSKKEVQAKETASLSQDTQSSYLSSEKVAQPEKQPPQQKKPEQKEKSAIRTYYDDMANLVQGQKLSMTDIALAEQKKRIKTKEEQAPEKTPKKETARAWGRFLLVIMALLLFVGGSGALIYVFLLRDTPDDVTVPQQTNTLIPVDAITEVPTRGAEDIALNNLLDDALSSLNASPNTITALQITDTEPLEHTFGSRELLQRLDVDIDAAFFRSIEPDYLVGVYHGDTNVPFLILSTSLFENAFAGMLRWERQMLGDLAFLAHTPPAPPPPLQATTSPTSTSPATDTRSLLTSQIEIIDVVVANRDVRALVDSLGNTRLMYSFPDKNTLIITHDPVALRAIFERLTEARLR